MRPTKKQDLIRSAVELVGIETLAERMRAPASVVEAWMKGDATMPDGKLVKLAGVLTEMASGRQA